MLQKRIHVWIFFVLLSMASVRGMGTAALPCVGHNKDIAVQFISSPEDKLRVSEHLCSLFDQVQEKVCVAVYWLTDESIKNELIKLKQRNVEVELILDETTCKCYSDQKKEFKKLVSRLSKNSIVPIVYPSDMIKKIAPSGRGIMHSKFVIIDDNIVFQGSVNFTGTAISPEQSVSNYEQAVTIYDADIAQRFLKQFEKIKKDTLHCYLDMIGQGVNGARLQSLAKMLYQEMPEFKKAVRNAVRFHERTPQEKTNIGTFFGVSVKEEKAYEKPSSGQRAWLEDLGESSQNFSKSSAFRAIQKHKQHGKKQDHERKMHAFKNSRNRMPVSNENIIQNEKAHVSAAQAKK